MMQCEVVNMQLRSISFLEQKKGEFLANINVCPSYDKGLFHHYEKVPDTYIGDFLGIKIYMHDFDGTIAYRGETTKHSASITMKNLIGYATFGVLGATSGVAFLQVRDAMSAANIPGAAAKVVVATALLIAVGGVFKYLGKNGLYTTDYYTNVLTLLNDLQKAMLNAMPPTAPRARA